MDYKRKVFNRHFTKGYYLHVNAKISNDRLRTIYKTITIISNNNIDDLKQHQILHNKSNTDRQGSHVHLIQLRT